MIALAIVAAYVVGWFLSAVKLTRFFNSTRSQQWICSQGWVTPSLCKPRCGRKYGCGWASRSVNGEYLFYGSAAALLWPLTALLVTVYVQASKPQRKDRLAHRIQELERELSLEGK